MSLAALAAWSATVLLLLHWTTLAIALWRCRRRGALAPSQAAPPMTVVRPLRGCETFTVETLAAGLRLDYPEFEILFCVAEADDPVIEKVRAAMAAHPDVDARLLIGDDRISANPKLNNMVKGWRAARHDRVVFIDSNVEVTRDVLTRLRRAWRPGTGAVSAPPIGIRPGNFPAEIECAFLNSYQARWQYCADTLGFGFAQGKTLFFRRSLLGDSAMADLATEPAEDAAATKRVRALGLRVRLAEPSPQPLGRRALADVWSRQLRWARLRRVTFPWAFAPEIATGWLLPIMLALLAAPSLGLPPAVAGFGLFGLWLLPEWLLAALCGWPAGWCTLGAYVARDAMLPALWFAAWIGREVSWQGRALRMARREPVAMPHATVPPAGECARPS